MAGFVVSHQLVSLDFDLDRHAVKGLTELSVEPNTQSLTTLRLHCERPVVQSVHVNGVACEFRRHAPGTRRQLVRKLLRTGDEDAEEGELEITIPSSVRIEAAADGLSEGAVPVAFKPLKLRIEFYMARPSAGLVFGCSDTDPSLVTVHTATQMYPSTTRTWLPCVDRIDQRSTWDLFFTVPACTGSLDDPESLLPLTVVSAGELSSLMVHPRDPLRRIFRYIVSTTTPACTLGFAIGPFTSACTLDGSLLANGEDALAGDASVTAVGGKDGESRGSGRDGDAQPGEHAAPPTDAQERPGDGTAPAGSSNDAAAAAAAAAGTDGDGSGDNQQVPSTSGDVADEGAARASRNSKLRKATVDAIGGVFAFTYPGLLGELETTCSFIPEALAFYSQEFGSYPYTSYKVVFMDGLSEPVITCASLTIASTDLLHPRTVIEPVYETRRCLGLAIAQQWFGTYVTPETWSDYWLVVGLAGYIAGLFVKHNLGNNEHRYRLKRDMTRLCHADVNQRPISYPEQPPVVMRDEAEFIQLKAPIILYMLDKRMMKGGMSLGLSRVVPKILVTAMSGDLGAANAVGTGWFLKMCRRVSGVDLQVFADQWILGTGCPVFHFSYAFNRKKLVVEIMMHQESTNSKATAVWARPQLFRGQMTARIREADGTPYEHVLDIRESSCKFEVQFNTKYKRIRRSTKRFHMRQMAAAAEELNVNTEVLGIEDDDETYSNIALFGAENEQEKRDWRVVEWGEDDEESLASATFEWIRMDSDMEWACIVHFEQPDFMWAAQLQKDRDVAAQLEAVYALQFLPSSAASTTLMRTVMDGRVFYRVRVDAALALERFATADLDWIGLHHLIKIYKRRYCLPPLAADGPAADQGDGEDIVAPRLPRPNNFANIGEYFTQKAILAALSNIRDRHSEAPLAARRLMLGALKYNDNSENVYSDCYFLSSLVHSLTNGIIASDRFARTYSVVADPPDDGAVLGEIERLRKLDMLVPSYHNVITRSCMEVLLKLSLSQPQEHLFNTALFFSMATPEAYVGVREAAVGGLMLHWGLGAASFNRFFVMLAADAGAPRLAATVGRYLTELLMIRAMVFGQQHNSLLFMEEEGKEATEHIDTDARLVGGLESLIDSISDSPELRTILAAAMHDSSLAQPARTLLGTVHMLMYQVVDCSVPPPTAKTHKKLKIKLGGRRKSAKAAGGALKQTGVKPAARSSASSDSEDMPLALSMSSAAPSSVAELGVGDPYAADVIPGEHTDVSGMPLTGLTDASESVAARRRLAHDREPLVDVVGEGYYTPSHGHGLPAIAGTRPPPIAGTRPPPIAVPDDRLNSPAYAGSAAHGSTGDAAAPQQQQQPQTKVKLKLKLSKASKPPAASPHTGHPPSRARSPSFSSQIPPSPHHSTVPRISSPLATSPLVTSPVRKAREPTPGGWSPVYEPTEYNVGGSPGRRRGSSTLQSIIGGNGHPANTGDVPGAAVSDVAPSGGDNGAGPSAPARKTMHRILRKISKHQSAFPFLRPVDVVLDGCPTYYDVIKHPMDLGTIKMKLEAPAGYSSPSEFEADIRLMFGNCYAFNPLGTPVHDMGKAVEAVFDTEWVKSGLSGTAAAPPATPAQTGGSKRKSTPKSLPDKDASAALVETPKRQKKSNGADAASIEVTAGDMQAVGGESSAVMTTPVGKGTKVARTTSTGKARTKKAETAAAAGTKIKTPRKRSSGQVGTLAALDAAGLGAFDDPDTIMAYLDHASSDTRPAAGGDWKAMCRRVLLRLQAQPSALEFMAPVDPIKQGVPTYFDVVTRPMDLGTIRKNLDRNVYQSPDAFRDDVSLVLTNCFLFNPPGTYVHDQGQALQHAFESTWKHQSSADVTQSPVPVDAILPDISLAPPAALERARAVVNKLKRDDCAWPFLRPVDPVALGIPSYFDIVKNPMDLSTIQKKLSKKAYAYVADYVADIQLIVDDCFLFNLPDTPVHGCGKSLLALAATLLEEGGWNRWLELQ